MEIETASRSQTPTPWGRFLLLVLVFGPVLVLVLLPIGLGLQRYVMTGDSMQGGIDRGSIVFERVVPVSDLRVGDVITYRAPANAEVSGMVTHRVVAIGPDGIVTRGDARTVDDPWTLQPEDATVSRVVLALPWIGWVYLFLLHPQGWLLTVVSAVALMALTSNRLLRRRGPTLRDDGQEAAVTDGEQASPTRIVGTNHE